MTIIEIVLIICILISLTMSMTTLVLLLKTKKTLKENDRNLASTMIMNFKEYDEMFEKNKAIQSDIQRDNKAIMNEISNTTNEMKKINEVIITLNNGFSIPSFRNVDN